MQKNTVTGHGQRIAEDLVDLNVKWVSLTSISIKVLIKNPALLAKGGAVAFS
jgi:hypothetical protein